jgi:N6-adenosine-specific RNA methylase IME4
MKTKQGGYEITETGLVVRDGWTPELWEAAGHEIARYQKGLMWLIGDWLNAGDREGYVERGKLDQACERFGIAYSTAAQAVRVAAAFPESCNRLQDLDWTHHMVVANHDQAAELLAWAEAEGATVKQLRERVREIKAADAPPLPEGVYRVIYADPPWEYGDKRTNDDQSGSAESQYQTMPIDEICAMPVRDMSAADSVLFLWATAPLLVEAVRVVEAWGFTYKAQFVWDKVKGFNGHYNDVRHELLLIATRGSCVPAVESLDPSIVQEKRTKHSRKPDCFYELIERLYPVGDETHVELFARRSRDGWTAWGNQVDRAKAEA